MLPGRAAVKQRPRLVWPEQPPPKWSLLLTLDGASGVHSLAASAFGDGAGDRREARARISNWQHHLRRQRNCSRKASRVQQCDAKSAFRQRQIALVVVPKKICRLPLICGEFFRNGAGN